MRSSNLVFLVVALACCVWTSSLSAADAGDAAPAVDEARVAALIKDLDSEVFETRDAADKELAKLGKAALPLLRKALDATADPEARNRLRRICDALSVPLVLTAEVVGEAQAGKPVKFKVCIKNVSEREIVAVACLDGSTSGKRYPKYNRTVTPAPAGPQVEKGFCGNCNGLTGNDLVELKSGESLEVLGEQTFGNYLAEWTPPKEGTYTLTFTCDYAQEDPKLWNGPIERRGGMPEALSAKLARVPKITLTTKVEVKVKP